MASDEKKTGPSPSKVSHEHPCTIDLDLQIESTAPDIPEKSFFEDCTRRVQSRAPPPPLQHLLLLRGRVLGVYIQLDKAPQPAPPKAVGVPLPVRILAVVPDGSVAPDNPRLDKISLNLVNSS